MATDNVRVLKVDTGVAQKSVKDLRNELKELKSTLLSTEEGTEEYSQALAQAAEITHTLQEQTEMIKASAADFGQIASNCVNAVGGMVSGFQAAKATLNLFGVENEEVMKSLQRMQNLMAITQALPGIDKGIKSLKNLTNVILAATQTTNTFSKAQKASAAAENASATSTKALQGAMVGEAAATTTATVATNAFKKALISTGIGAIVVLVGTLIAHLEDLAKWLGFGGSSTEALEKQTTKLKQAYENTNATLKQYSTFLEGLKFAHEEEEKALELEVQKMEAAGASEAAIIAKRKENLAVIKENAEEEIQLLDKEQASIESKYLALMKNIAGATYNTTLSMQSMYNELAEAQRLVIANEHELENLEANGSKKDIEKQKQRLEQAKQRVTLLETYIGTQKQEIAINDKVNTAEVRLEGERKKRDKKAVEDKKKLVEEYKKFTNQIVINTKTGLQKELAEHQVAEQEKLAKLEEFHKKKIISETEYQKQRKAIIDYYNDLDAKSTYAAQELRTKKVQEIEKKNAELEKDFRKTDLEARKLTLRQEEADLIQAFNRREISLVEFYQQEKEIVLKGLEDERKAKEDDYKANVKMIEQQIADNEFLMQQKGIPPERQQEIVAQNQQLYDSLLLLQQEYNNQVTDLEQQKNEVIAESNAMTIQAQMDVLTAFKDNVVSAMDAITSIGEGISSEWATAFDTLMTGVINLSEKVKEGTAGWGDYAQMAGAAFAAVGSMMNGLAQQQDASNKEGFEKQKKYQIAAATMQMLAGIATALSGVFTTKTGPWDIALAAIQAGIIATTGAIQIAKIKQQKFDGGSSSSSVSSPNTGAVASVIAPVQYTQDVQGASIEGAIKDNKVYVVESDITNTQNKVSVTENEAVY